MTSDRVVSDLMLPLWAEVLWPFLDAWDTVRLRTTFTQWNVPRRLWAVRRALLLPVKIQDSTDFVNSGRAGVQVFQGPSDMCSRASVNLWHRDGHCTRFL